MYKIGAKYVFFILLKRNSVSINIQINLEIPFTIQHWRRSNETVENLVSTEETEEPRNR
jgi:hypothetical protein